MIKYRNGDLLEQKDVNIIVHQCNCFCTMGAGIAKAIAKKYPLAKLVDIGTIPGDEEKLGVYSWVKNKVDGVTVINLYSQYGYGRGMHTNYVAMREGLTNLKEHLTGYASHVDYEVVLGIPHSMGCGLAGGDWNIVDRIIHEIFDDAVFNVVICKLGK